MNSPRWAGAATSVRLYADEKMENSRAMKPYDRGFVDQSGI